MRASRPYYGRDQDLQPELFAPHNHTDTSKAAAKYIAITSQTKRERIYRLLCELGIEGATNEEMSRALGMPIQTVCGRVAELREEKRVVDSGRRRPGASGVNAKVWRAT